MGHVREILLQDLLHDGVLKTGAVYEAERDTPGKGTGSGFSGVQIAALHRQIFSRTADRLICSGRGELRNVQED